jgi:hypothetical protein
MSDEMQLNLIQTYTWVCEMFDRNPQWSFIRMSNNNQAVGFTDQEAVTIYLFVGKQIKLTDKKEIHSFAKHFLLEWFPKLTSYEKFNNRLNVIYPVFYDMVDYIVSNHIPQNAQGDKLLIDSLPIITCKSRNRTGKVAPEATDKGYCSTKRMYYFGLKLHLLAMRNKGTLPFPCKICFSAASENDLAFVREMNWLDDLYDVSVFADKAYCDQEYFQIRKQAIQLDLFTPIKEVKGTPEHIKQFDFAHKNLLSTAVSKVRQPIESFFNWIIQKSDIQDATKVRSTNGLWMHCFGKLAIALLNFVF